jgi:hypothetical protein
VKVGDLVRFKDPNHPALYPYMKEAGIVMRFELLGKNPVVFFPSATKAFLKNKLEVVSESC